MARLMIETMAGADGERRHVFGGLNRFLGWAMKTGLIKMNPLDALDHAERPKPGRPRDHVPSIKTLRLVWAAVEDEPQRDLMRLLLLVPLRRDEAAGLRWSEVDLPSGRIRISANRMKNREAHELPLSKPALAIVEAREPTRTGSDELVFPSGEDKPYDGWGRLAKRIRKRIGQTDAGDFTFHDVRRAFVSHLAERGFDVDLLDQCLGHSRKGVFGIYQRASRMAERGRAMEAWGGLVTGAGEGARVLAFRAKT